MSDSYHYEDGAIHHDHKQVLHIDKLSGDDLGKLIKAFFKGDAEDAEVVEEVKEVADEDALLAENKQGVSGVLASDDAMKYWERLQQKGFVDERCQLRPETTRKQAMYIAEVFAERLGVKSKWKTFERLWGISNLAQEKWDMQETGMTPSRSQEIDKIFKD